MDVVARSRSLANDVPDKCRVLFVGFVLGGGCDSRISVGVSLRLRPFSDTAVWQLKLATTRRLHHVTVVTLLAAKCICQVWLRSLSSRSEIDLPLCYKRVLIV